MNEKFYEVYLLNGTTYNHTTDCTTYENAVKSVNSWGKGQVWIDKTLVYEK